MDCISPEKNKNHLVHDQSCSEGCYCESSCNDRKHSNENTQNRLTSRRAVVPAIAGVVAVGSMPSTWRRPLINSVLLPAHAQTTTAVNDPQWVLSGLSTQLAVPSGETLPVESYSRLKFSGCGLIPGSNLTITVTAEISPSGVLPLITAATLTVPSGTFDSFIPVDAGAVVVTSIVTAFQFDIDVDGDSFTYTANAAAIGAAAAGTAVPASC